MHILAVEHNLLNPLYRIKNTANRNLFLMICDIFATIYDDVIT